MADSESSSLSSSTVTITSIPRIRVGQVVISEFDIRLHSIARCRYLVLANGIAEVHYQGTDLHYHRATLHSDFVTHELEAITIHFCYRAFRRITNGPFCQYIFRRQTFCPPPRNILFCQLDEHGRRQPSTISIGRLYDRFENLSDEEQRDHDEQYHINPRQMSE